MSVPNSSMVRTAQVGAVQSKLVKIDAMLADGKITAMEAAKRRHAAARQLTARRWQLNIDALLGLLLAVAVVLAIVRSLTGTGGLLWLVEIPALPQEVGEFATVLAPLLAVAVAIERLLETFFDWFEQATRSTADVLAAPKETLDWIGREYQEAYEATAKVAESRGIVVTPDSAEALSLAEERLAKAEARLRSWTDAPEYKAWKRAISIWVGLLTGLVLAVLGDLGMFHTIGMPVPRLLDMLITGLIIGAGPGPMHSLIGILQSGKDAMNNVAELAKGKAVRDAAEALLIQSNLNK
jgi:hypothetical protein